MPSATLGMPGHIKRVVGAFVAPDHFARVHVKGVEVTVLVHFVDHAVGDCAAGDEVAVGVGAVAPDDVACCGVEGVHGVVVAAAFEVDAFGVGAGEYHGALGLGGPDDFASFGVKGVLQVFEASR